MNKKEIDEMIKAVRSPKTKYECDTCFKKFVSADMVLTEYTKRDYSFTCKKCHKKRRK